jgi:nucleotide-binding universal stress UspA family protein
VAAADHRLVAERLVSEAEAWGSDQIVVGSRGRSRHVAVLLGATSARVVRMANCPVVVARSHRPHQVGTRRPI